MTYVSTALPSLRDIADYISRISDEFNPQNTVVWGSFCRPQFARHMRA
jgi:hypothetical protein